MKKTMIKHTCGQCGIEFDRNLKGIKKSGISFCTRTCYTMYSRGSLIGFYSNIDILKLSQYQFMIEFPLDGYNAFFKRSVPIETFVQTAKELASKNPKIPAIEYFLFSAYFLAARRDCKTFVPLDDMYKAFPTANSKIVNRYVLEKDLSESCALSNRAGALINRDIESMKRHDLIHDHERVKIRAIIDELDMKDLSMQRIKAAHAIVYVASILAGININQVTFAGIVNTSTNTIRNNTQYIVKILLKNEKFDAYREIVSKKRILMPVESTRELEQ